MSKCFCENFVVWGRAWVTSLSKDSFGVTIGRWFLGDAIEVSNNGGLLSALRFKHNLVLGRKVSLDDVGKVKGKESEVDEAFGLILR